MSIIPENSGQSLDTGYHTWLNEADRQDQERIRLQNQSRGRGRWGIGYGEYLDFIQKHYQPEGKKFHPKRIAELGVASDATLVIETLKRFGKNPDFEGIDVYELSEARLAGAQQSIESAFPDNPKHPSLARKVRYFPGDASQTLAASGEAYDLINAQLLFQHLLLPTRATLIQAAASHLSPQGLFLIDDLAARDWHVRTGRLPWLRRERRNQVTSQVADINETIAGIRHVIWDPAQKPDFNTAEDIEQMVVGSASQLALIPKLRRETRVDNIKPEEIETQMTVQTLSQTTANAPEAVQERVERYIFSLLHHGTEMIFSHPTMVRRAFRLSQLAS